MGKAPQAAGAGREQGDARSPAIPAQEIVAIGYEDGMILLVRIEDGAEILAKRPGDGAGRRRSPGTRDGARLAFGTEDGEAGILDAVI